MSMRYKRNNSTKDNPQCAQDTNETIKLQTVLNVREILTKQSNLRQSSVCAKYKRKNPTKDNRQFARDINETIKLETILMISMCEILMQQSN